MPLSGFPFCVQPYAVEPSARLWGAFWIPGLAFPYLDGLASVSVPKSYKPKPPPFLLHVPTTCNDMHNHEKAARPGPIAFQGRLAEAKGNEEDGAETTHPRSQKQCALEPFAGVIELLHFSFKLGSLRVALCKREDRFQKGLVPKTTALSQ